MVTSDERQKANMARMNCIMEEIGRTQDDFALIVELQELLRKRYPLSSKWLWGIFKIELKSSLMRLDYVRKKEIEEASGRRKRREPPGGLKQVYSSYKEIPKAYRNDYYMECDTETNHNTWIKMTKRETTRTNVFDLPKSMIGDDRLHWSEELKEQWGDDLSGRECRDDD